MERRALIATTAGAVALGALATTPAEARTRRGEGPLTAFNVISDIQGDLGDLATALRDMHATNPHSSGLAVAGDITPRGYDAEYAEVRRFLARNPHPGESAAYPSSPSEPSATCTTTTRSCGTRCG